MGANSMILKIRENQYLVSNVQVAGFCSGFKAFQQLPGLRGQLPEQFGFRDAPNARTVSRARLAETRKRNIMRGANWFPGCTEYQDSFQRRMSKDENILNATGERIPSRRRKVRTS
ncbi:Protein CBG14975 [Caenorhabditis briggsae]|uniref:Protein CBG14975 n=1 Tax=Caenorhabditis briggsae TaxID=6238 RepID=A8XL48_CAEBR|nr:Protein CBG14975 [Caenorhabditis briggsae]CAP33373.1 Protein CBG14975 [Caenorhabditis briggsae]